METVQDLNKDEIDRCVVEKEFKCQVCSSMYKNHVVRKLKIKTLYTESDLRPICEPVDPNFYDVLICSNCGYAVLSMAADKRIKKDRVEMVKEGMELYSNKVDYPKILTPKYVIERYKLVIISSILKGADASEKAYACLKLAWVYRSIENKENEKFYLINAVSRFEKAYLDEDFPICGLDPNGLGYLIGVLNHLVGNDEDALSWTGKVLTARDISSRLRNKAIDLKEEIRAKMG